MDLWGTLPVFKSQHPIYSEKNLLIPTGVGVTLYSVCSPSSFTLMATTLHVFLVLPSSGGRLGPGMQVNVSDPIPVIAVEALNQVPLIVTGTFPEMT